MLSLEFVLGFCQRIAKRGDCKVEFNQPFCWLYSVTNFLVIQHLQTLYLGGNHVRVVCERVWRKAQKCAFYRASRLDLTTGSWLASRLAHVWSMQRSWRVTPVVALQEKSPRLARQLAPDLNSRLSPIVKPSRQTIMFGKNWPFAFQTHISINTPYTHVL